MLHSLFDMDNIFWQTINAIVDFIILNFICLICCLPIVTIGASFTALYTMTMKIAKKEENYIVHGFFKAFKENFKQATIIWIIMLLIGSILGTDIYLTQSSAQSPMNFLSGVFVFLGLIYVAIFSYVFPIQAQFINPIKVTFKNSAMLCISNLVPWTILIIFINAFPLILVTLLENIAGTVVSFMLVCGFSSIAFVNSLIFNRIFKPYIPAVETDI